jgi:allantoin racemase
MNPTTPKKLLLINPNTHTEVTQRLKRFLEPSLPKFVHLEAVTARFGAPYIACEASHAVAAHAVLDAWAHHLNAHSTPDGILIACFGDPGLFALRDSSASAVTGLAEGAFTEAAAYGDFAVVTGGKRWEPMLMRLAQGLGFGPRLRLIEIVQPTGAQLMADQELALNCLTRACQSAQSKGVRSIIIGGAGLAGYAQKLQPQFDVPLIDSVEAGLRVLLSGAIVPGNLQHSGFHTPWQSMPAAMQALELG